MDEMDTLKEKTINSKMIFEGNIINLRVDEVELPNGNLSKREIVEHSGGVAVVACKDSKVIMVEQFRKPGEEILLELPAGKLEKDEDKKGCAYRELEEETGYRATSLEWLCSFYTSPGFTDEIIEIYLAKELIKYEQNPDDDEFVRVKELEIAEVARMLAEGEFRDAKTIIGLQYLLAQLDRQ